MQRKGSPVGPGVRVPPVGRSPARGNRGIKTVSLPAPAKAFTPPVTVAQSIIMLLHGSPGMGKSTFGASADHHYFFRCQEGAAFLRHRGDSVPSWEAFLARVEQFENILETPEGRAEYLTFVIDTVDDLFRYCTDFCARLHGFDHVSDLEYAKGYDMVRQEFHNGIARLCSLPVTAQRKCNVIFLCQSEDRQMQIKKGGIRIEQSIRQSNIPKTAKRVIIPLVDLIGFIREHDQDRTKRIVQFAGDETLEAKDRSGRLPPAIVITKDDGWKKVKAYIEGRVRMVRKGGT